MKVGLIGAGAIGTYLLNELNKKEDQQIGITSVLVRDEKKYEHLEEKYQVALFTNLDAFLQSEIDIVVEAANVEAVKNLLPKIVEEKDIVIISIGALAEIEFLDQIKEIVEKRDHNLYIPSGAIGGLDLVQHTASVGILKSVNLTTRKPASTLVKEPIKEACVVFEGNAMDAIKKYPKNINVSIALALSGIGFDKTNVTLIADPDITKNIHMIDVQGDFGSASFTIQNNPLPANPNTSYLAAVSIIGTLKQQIRHFKIG